MLLITLTFVVFTYSNIERIFPSNYPITATSRVVNENKTSLNEMAGHSLLKLLQWGGGRNDGTLFVSMPFFLGTKANI